MRLGKIALKLTDGTHRTPKYTDSGIPFLSVKDISNGKLNFSKTKFISRKEHTELFKRCNPEKGDLLITKVGTTGIPTIIDVDTEFSLFVSVALLKFNNNLIDINYLYNVILSPLVQNQVKENTKGIGNKNWVIDKIGETIISLPPLSEQKRIVAKIEELLPHIDEYGKCEVELSKLNKNFPEVLKKSILQAAVQGKLVSQDPNDESAEKLLEKIRAERQKLIKEGKIKKSKTESQIFRRGSAYYEKCGSEEKCIDKELPFEIPNSWRWVRLGNIGNWGSGATPTRGNPKYYNEGKIPWLKTGDLNDSIVLEIPEKITDIALKETSVKLNPIGSILIAMYGATIGKVGILGVEATTNQACCACQTLSGVWNKYLFYFLLSQRENFKKQSEGGAQPNISKEKIIAYLFPFPPLEEQKRIVAKIEELFAIVDSMKK